jgi:hypothetical protein
MAKNKISEWSSVAANNTDVGGVDIAEGCAPSGINNAIRELMAQVKDMITGADGDSQVIGGNLTVNGTSTLTGAVTAPAGVTGNVTGNLTGNVTGNVSGTSSNVTGTVAVANGGTGATSIAANNVILGNGTSAVKVVAPSTSGNILTSNGTTWTSAAAPVQKSIGNFSSRSAATDYTASSDGWVVVNTTNGSAIYGGFTILVNGTEVVKSRSPSEGGNGWQTGMFPIKSGQSYRFNLTGGGVSLLSAYFIPFE